MFSSQMGKNYGHSTPHKQSHKFLTLSLNVMKILSKIERKHERLFY